MEQLSLRGRQWGDQQPPGPALDTLDLTMTCATNKSWLRNHPNHQRAGNPQRLSQRIGQSTLAAGGTCQAPPAITPPGCSIHHRVLRWLRRGPQLHLYPQPKPPTTRCGSSPLSSITPSTTSTWGQSSRGQTGLRDSTGATPTWGLVFSGDLADARAPQPSPPRAQRAAKALGGSPDRQLSEQA